MPIQLSSPITDLKGIGPAKAKVLSKLGIAHVRDFLFSFPRRYEDFSNITPIANLVLGKQMTVKGKVQKVKSDWGFQGKRRLLRIYVDIADDTGVLHVTWYNLRFLEKQLTQDREIFIAGVVEHYKFARGKHEFAMRTPAMEFVGSGERTHTAAITPIYPETKGVTSRLLRYYVRQLLPIIEAVPEYMPTEMIARYNLIGIRQALRWIHFPASQEELKQAEDRLRFDELFFLQLAALVRRQLWQKHTAPALSIDQKEIQHASHKLPFKLTGAQTGALEEIVNDLNKGQPMNRLLQGDVGSGKSAVALIATIVILDKGYKILYVAPTEILARQQAKSFTNMLGKHRVELLIGATRPGGKRDIKKRLMDKEPICVVGTHALLQEDIEAKHVGLVIIDEQHRFGVNQRLQLLRNAAEDNNSRPHLLSMTATPIPRTLNLTVYGDLDVSILNELPPGRKPITTNIIEPDKRDEAILHVLQELHSGRQGYIIAPLIEVSEKLEVRSAKETYKEMQHLFPGVAIGLLHGAMDSEEKEAVMNNFAAGAIQLLVSTAVVEVGVNVPNATIMIIEGAERFGLSQLHQFRGRIGRGEHQSFCYLFPTTIEASRSERMAVIASSTDGFVIAEEDLRLRGPGEMYGVAQSGFAELKVATLLDYQTIKRARRQAEQILTADPELKAHPVFRKKVEQKNLKTHLE